MRQNGERSSRRWRWSGGRATVGAMVIVTALAGGPPVASAGTVSEGSVSALEVREGSAGNVTSVVDSLTEHHRAAKVGCKECHRKPDDRPAGTPASWRTSSAICLRCHESSTRPGHAFIGGHPVSVTYPVADPDFAPEALVRNAGLPLPGGRVECYTCHDVHELHQLGEFHEGDDLRRGDSPAPAGVRVEMRASRLCLTCHRK